MKVDVWPSVLAGHVDAPGSKSDAQRMVACALLAKGTSVIHRFPQADDCEAALRVAEAAYRFGERGILEVLDAQRVLRSVRADLLQARFQAQAARVVLEQLAARYVDR